MQIRERDNNLCQACLCGKYLTINRITYNNLSVHHIIPLAEDASLSLSDTNLITLCDMHHDMAEAGEIARVDLLELARRQEERAKGSKEEQEG